MKLWHIVGSGCVLGSLVGCHSEAGEPNLPPTQEQPAPSTGTDRVASCDEADDGTPCVGEPGEVTHCIFDACVVNACGDGFAAGNEECDDGDEIDGDGCSARCMKEGCGNRVRDPGEACDDGNLADGDGCSAQCQVEPGDSDAGSALDAGAAGCPHDDADGGTEKITASASSALLGRRVSLKAEAVDGASYSWWSEAIIDETAPHIKGAGSFASAQHASTQFTCTKEGDVLLSLYISVPGCLPVVYSTVIACDPWPTDAGTPFDGGSLDAGSERDAETPPDGGDGLDAEVDATMGGELDSGVGDADAAGGGETDSSANDASPGSEPEAGTEDGGQAGNVLEACLQCAAAQCADFDGLNLAGPCFENDPAGLFGPLEQPATTQACTRAVACSVLAPSKCASDGAPVDCYCGQQTQSECESNGPLQHAECVAEWLQATGCEGVPVEGNQQNSCVATAFNDLTLASGYALYAVQCLHVRCQEACAL